MGYFHTLRSEGQAQGQIIRHITVSKGMSKPNLNERHERKLSRGVSPNVSRMRPCFLLFFCSLFCYPSEYVDHYVYKFFAWMTTCLKVPGHMRCYFCLQV
ncbi:unnamed protein product [Camellia sinensis]